VSLILTPVPGIPLIKAGDDLSKIILSAMERAGLSILPNDILVIAQKVVSKAEGRLVNLASVVPSEEATSLAVETEKDARLVELILRESCEVLRKRPGAIIVEHRCGFVCANAGIDHSNVKGDGGNDEDWVLLLPEDPDQSAHEIQQKLITLSGCQVGVAIIDSHGRAWRNGTVGTCIGLAGVPGLVDLRGKPDLFGYQLKITQVGAGDELAAAASLVMGQADEGTPVVHVRGFPYAFRETSLKELIRPREMDMFR